MNKLSRKNIEMLEMLATTPELEDKLAEYVAAEKVASKLWKEFREAVVNGEGVKAKSPNELRAEVEVDKVVKPVETKRKFKAGDKVRVNIAGLTRNQLWDLATTGLENGAITEVIGYKEDDEAYSKLGIVERPVIVEEVGECGFFDESVLELVEEKSPNELRAEVIQRAKEFVGNDSGIHVIKRENYYAGTSVEFVVNENKKTVVALMRNGSRKLMAKGIAKCHPDDVYNEHIGKAIALGRALGKDVSEFVNAVQPSKLAVGMVIRRNYFNSTDTYEREIEKIEGEALHYAGGDYDSGISDTDNLTVIDDTNAIYEEEM